MNTLNRAATALRESLANDGVPICHEPDAEPHTVHLFLGGPPIAATIAVLRAIREPDNASTLAGCHYLDEYGVTLGNGRMAGAFQAMLDTIIAEMETT